MSIDVTNPDAMPVRVRRRSRGAQSVTSSPALPTLLRVPDVRPPSRIAAVEGGLSGVKLVAATAPPVNEAWAANLGQVRTETTTTHDPQDTKDPKASTSAIGSGRKSNAIADSSTLAKVKRKTIDAMSRFAKKWSSQLRTWGAIAAAVIACTLAAWAMKPDDFDAAPLPERMVMSEETARGAGSDQKDIEVTNFDASDDIIAFDTSNSAAGPNTESISGVSRSTQGDMHADSFYANSQPFAGTSGPMQNNQRASAPRHAPLESTLAGDSPQPGVPSNIMYPHHIHQQPWASSPTDPQTRYALDQPLPQIPLEGSVAPRNVLELDTNVTPVDPSDVWPSPTVNDNEHAQIQTWTPHTARYSANTVASSPQSPRGYPTTDRSRYGSFGDLKRALIERKLERDPQLHMNASRPLVPTRNPRGATGNLPTEAVYNRSGAYR